MADNEQIARSLYAAMSEHDIDAMKQVVAEDVIEHEASPLPDPPPGREGVMQWFSVLMSAFPDMRVEVKDLVAQNDRVACRARLTATQQGDFMGMPASGKAIDVEIFDFLRFRDGLVAEHWGLTEDMKMMAQLGAAPTPA